MHLSEIIGLFLVFLGFMLGVLNWVISIKRIINKDGASAVFLVPLIFVLLGSVLLDEQPYKIYLWAILVIDFTVIPTVLIAAYNFLFGKQCDSQKT